MCGMFSPEWIVQVDDNDQEYSKESLGSQARDTCSGRCIDEIEGYQPSESFGNDGPQQSITNTKFVVVPPHHPSWFKRSMSCWWSFPSTLRPQVRRLALASDLVHDSAQRPDRIIRLEGVLTYEEGEIFLTTLTRSRNDAPI